MDASEGKIKVVRCRANLWLQILLYFNVYFAHAWILIYGCNILYELSNLWNFQGAFVMVAFVVSVVVEYGRLYAGYSGNLRARTGDLSTFLIISPLIQLPILAFLLLSPVLESTLADMAICVLLSFMGGEIMCGLYAWRKLSLHQHELFKLKRDIYLQRHAQVKRPLSEDSNADLSLADDDDDDGDAENGEDAMEYEDREDMVDSKTTSVFYLKRVKKKERGQRLR